VQGPKSNKNRKKANKEKKRAAAAKLAALEAELRAGEFENSDSDGVASGEDSDDSDDYYSGGTARLQPVPALSEKESRHDSGAVGPRNAEINELLSLHEHNNAAGRPAEHLYTPVTSFGALSQPGGETSALQRRMRPSDELIEACAGTIGGGVGPRPLSALQPTAVQSECWGALLSSACGDLDLIAISATGSGKTLAFLLPLIAAITAASSGKQPGPELELEPELEPEPEPEPARREAQSEVQSETQSGPEPEPQQLESDSGSDAVPDQESHAEPHLLESEPCPGPGPEPKLEPETAMGLQFVRPAALVVAPTRELCQQIAAVAEGIAASPGMEKLSVACIVGGVDYVSQRAQLLSNHSQGIVLLMIATVGRLLSICGEVPASTKSRNTAAVADAAACELAGVAILVLDEADRMLDLGFEADIKAVLRLIAIRHGMPRSFLDPAVHPQTIMCR
jgi:hypothetical protein